MRTAEDRAELRARRGETIVTTFSGTAAALRLLGHDGKAEITKEAVVRWRFPASAKLDLARVDQEMRHASAERYTLWRKGPPE